MNKFRFDPLLKVRENTRNIKKNELVEMIAARNEAQQRLEAIQADIDVHRIRWQAAQNQAALDVNELNRMAERFEFLDHRKNELLDEIERLQTELNSRQDALNEAVKDVKILENLRERKWEEQQEENRRKDNF